MVALIGASFALLPAGGAACDGEPNRVCPENQVMLDGYCVRRYYPDDHEHSSGSPEYPYWEGCGPDSALERIEDDGGVPTGEFRCVPTDAGVD